MADDPRDDPLAVLGGPTRAWFAETFAAPTPAQRQAWPHAAAGRNVLVSAPTGSGKTLAAFLVAIDRLISWAPGGGGGAVGEQRRTRVLYVSPLKALAHDVDRNLRAPLVGIRRTAASQGVQAPEVDVAMRTGDTPADERRRMARHPPEVLITTPESLFLLLTSKAREMLAGVETVIVDEVHAVAGTKRGAHLALSLERVAALAEHPLQRLGLSATVRPLEEVGRFLGGGRPDGQGGWTPRPVELVHVPPERSVDVDVVVPIEDMGRLGERVEEPPSGPASSGAAEQRRSIWPAVHPRILDIIEANRATIVFANSRRLAERLCARLNELAGERLALPVRPDDVNEAAEAHDVDEADEAVDAPAAQAAAADAAGAPDVAAEPVVARAHHGSVAREERLGIEEALKTGRLPCVVATSSLELGIDMGAVDQVVQVESPGSVAAGLQRVGRAGHHVGEPSRGTIFPKFRGDLLESAVVADRMRAGAIESTTVPRLPLDVLAQQVVALAAMDAWAVDDVLALCQRAAPFAELSRSQLDGVLDLLAGRYPSDEFAELRPRVTWDRVEDVIRGRRGAQRVAVTSGGTIPDRGLYRVELAAGEEDGSGGGGAGARAPKRVGELDEEMVYECRPGETVVLGASTWRITDIERDRVLVVPAPGEPGKLPFWHGDAPSRPAELGAAVGQFVRELGDAPADQAGATLRERYGLDDWAADNLVTYLAEQREATGTLPHDRQLVIERFRDEIGDWRIVIHSPFGGAVHAPWAMAIAGRARERLGLEVQTMHADDGIVVRLPEADEAPPADWLLLDAEEVEDLVVGELGGSALLAARFRECAARALLLPRRGGPGRRTPLWQQRQRAADLLQVASRYGSFPILLETYREILQDTFDLPGLQRLLGDIAARRVRIHQVETPQASPFASSLLFDYLAGSIYDGDAPLAERRANALALDRERLAELLGSEELRDLIDADALDRLEGELQRLAEDRRARDLDEVADLLRVVGDLRTDEVAARVTPQAREAVEEWLQRLAEQRRVFPARIGGEARWAAAEDAARLRDALGVPPPAGLPETFLEPVERPTIDLVARYARTHGPFRAADVAGRLGLPIDTVEVAGKELEAEGRLVAGEFRPGGAQREWVDAEVLRRLRRMSLAALRREVEPVDPRALARFLPGWQGIGSGVPGVDRVFEAVEQLQGAAVPASVLERDVLGVRVGSYRPAWLDELLAAGEVVWLGRGALGSSDGRVALYLRDQAALLAPRPPSDPAGALSWWSERHAALWERLSQAPAFWPELHAAVGGGPEAEAVEALWDLVWAGLVTNDALHPLRARLGLGGGARGSGGSPARRRRRSPRALSRSGPPTASGRWTSVAEVLAEGGAGALGDSDRGAALAAQLLDRHGVLTRDAVASEEVPGGFAGLYPVLQQMEESGRARRGYFVEGLGGAQFALPGAVDRLRAVREPGMEDDADAVILAATDPANPYGVTVPWPEAGVVDGSAGGGAAGGRSAGASRHRPQRRAGAWVVLADGAPLAYVERGGRSLLTFTDDDEALALAAEALAVLVDRGRADQLAISRIDGAELGRHPLLDHLRAAGFVDHPKGLIRRPSR